MYESYLQTRGIVVSTIEQTGNNRLTIAGQEKLTGNHVNLMLNMSSDPPRMTGLRMVGANTNQSELSSKSEEEMLRELDEAYSRP